MLIDWSILILIIVLGVFFCAMYSLKMIISLYTADKYLKASRALQLNLNKTQRALREMPEYPAEALQLPGDLGSIIQAVKTKPEMLRQWGIDPSILKNPIIQGIADKLLGSFQTRQDKKTIQVGNQKINITEDLFTD